MQEMNMNTNEVKAYLEISGFIFNTLMKKGQLNPINRDTWRLDGSFLFKREDIEKLKENVKQKELPYIRQPKIIM